MKKARLAQQRGYSERFQSEKGMGDSREVGCMATLSDVEELPVGPELNDGQV